MRIDWNAAAVVVDREEAVGIEPHLDPRGMAGHRFVHRIVDHLGEQVVHRLVVGAADIHARPPAHRLESFQNLDGRCVIHRLQPARKAPGGHVAPWTRERAPPPAETAAVFADGGSVPNRSSFSMRTVFVH